MKTNWISVKDRLPDADLNVLIATTGDEPVWLGYHDGDEWREVSGAPVEVTDRADMAEPPRK